MATMTLAAVHSRDAAYWGDRGDWEIAYEIHRDSDVLERSNFRSMERLLSAIPDSDNPDGDADVQVERSSHWAVGWIDRLIVRPGSAAAEEAKRLRAKLDDYPVLDEEDWSSLEIEEADATWKSFSLRGRIDYCKRYDVSIFAARRDEVPDDPRGEMVMALAAP
jgi:hypothetical protein